MREIYRAKLRNGESWVYWNHYGQLTTASGKRHSFKKETKHGGSLYYNIEQILRDITASSIGRWTGLTDKSGRKIFEGDILQTEGYKFYVAFGKCGGVVNNKYFGYQGYYLAAADPHTADMFKYGLRDDIFYYSGSYGLEVIGNIHDNPEFIMSLSTD